MATEDQAMMAQANREVTPHVNQNASTMGSHLRDFTRMNPLMFFGYKVNEDPKDFLDEVYKILYAMGQSSNEKAKDVAQTWYTQWKDNRALRKGPIRW